MINFIIYKITYFIILLSNLNLKTKGNFIIQCMITASVKTNLLKKYLKKCKINHCLCTASLTTIQNEPSQHLDFDI